MRDRVSELAGKAVRKYLERYAEPEAAAAGRMRAEDGPAGHVLCIPAYGEGEGLLDTLASVPAGPRGPVAMVVVVNEPADAPAWARRANRSTLASLRARFGPPGMKEGPIERFRHPRGSLWLVDRTGSGARLPRGQGVGLARKIGADIALRFWACGRLRSPWLHCTDADALLPPDYFVRPLTLEPAARGKLEPAALLYDFLHEPVAGPENARAVLRYEIFLRYYVLGLRAAGSPYAHQSLGSTIALSPLAYARVRGVPRRAAGEDFHLLAKLAKVGSLTPLRGDPIRLSGRVSTRVPFGTGAGVARELRRLRADAFYPAYDPRVFAWLRVWLGTLADLGTGRAPSEPIEAVFRRHASREPEVDRASLWGVLVHIGAVGAAEAGRRRGARHLHEWFDALRTLRFIHEVRDRHLPAIPLDEALERAPFVETAVGDDHPMLRRALADQEASVAATPGATPTASAPLGSLQSVSGVDAR